MARDYPQPDEAQSAGNPGMGCIIMACALAMFSGIAIYGVWAGMKQDRDIGEFTDDVRKPVPSERGTTEEWNALKDRMKAFEKTALAKTDVARLELTVRDFNLIVSNSDLLLASREMIFFESIEPDGLHGQISMPINRIAFWKGPRYLNGTARIVIESNETQLFLRMSEVDVPGRTVQKGFIERLAQSDLLAPYNREDEPLDPVIRTITSAKIEGDKVVILADPAARERAALKE